MAVIEVIEARRPENGGKEAVAAYCRVSTNSEDQLNSFRDQVDYYTNLIESNENWVLADIYADRAISGTQKENREEFQRMLRDCREGKIQRILVKSISRFSRNTMELIETTRELKQLGVAVVFEEQHLDTSEMFGEMQLAMHAMAAQEESLNIGRNATWGIRKQMESGNYVGTRAPYGYTMEKGKLSVNKDEAHVVRQIFRMFLQGKGTEEIAAKLNAQKIPCRNGEKWKRAGIRYILKSERYTGDALLQKRYIADSITHLQKQNRRVLPQYYISSCHQAIISHEVFDNAQELIKIRAERKDTERSPLTHRIQCPDCGAYFRSMNTRGKRVWGCPRHINGLSSCRKLWLQENEVIEATLNLLWKLKVHCCEILDPAIDMLEEIISSSDKSDKKLWEINQAIMDVNNQLTRLIRLQQKGFLDPQEFNVENERLTAERAKLYSKRKERLNGRASPGVEHELIELKRQLEAAELPFTDFPEETFYEIVEKIIPEDSRTLSYHFYCGINFKEAIAS